MKIEILNQKAIELLKDLESLGLIKLHEEEATKKSVSKYKGAMRKQPLDKVEEQLKNLRNEWEE